MRKITSHFFFLLLVTSFTYTNFAQDGGIKYNGNLGTEIEQQFQSTNIVDVSEISQLDQELKQAIESGDMEKESLLRTRILQLDESKLTVPNLEDRDYPVDLSTGSFIQPDWLGNDVAVYSGDIGQTGSDHRRIDLETGEDGNLYAAYIKRPQTGVNGRIDVVKSTDGGLTWTMISGVQSATAYFGQASITVEVRSSANSNLDSTRIFLFYSRSADAGFNDATINYASFLRDGTGWKGGISVMTPTAGNKLLYPSAVSDGQYFTTATYIGVVCGEYSNDNTQGIALRLARTTNWGDSYTSESIVDGYPTWGDWFPSADFKNDVTDSVYIAVERRFTSSASQLRIIATPWAPSTGFKRYSITDVVTDEYKKPDLTIAQDASTLPKKIIVAFIRNGQANYSRSMNGGASWTLNSSLGLTSENNITYVAINSDSNATSNDYVVAAYQKSNSDSIVIRRGLPGSLGTRIHQVNEFQSSTFNSPVVAIYNPSGTKSSTLLYTGLVSNYTSNVYFDGEHLVSNISELPGIAEQYSLDQNYPNPFNPSTSIRFSIPEQTNVSLKIFNSIGQEVASLVNGELSAGNHEVNFNASKLSSGVYFYRIDTPAFTSTKKMILIK